MLMQATLAADMADALRDQIVATLGATSKLQAWDGTPPASIGAGDAGTKVAEIAMNGTPFGAVVAFICQSNSTTDDTATVAGTVQYWRLKDSGGNTIFQWTEGVDMVTDDPTFGSGDTCHLVDLTMGFSITPLDS